MLGITDTCTTMHNGFNAGVGVHLLRFLSLTRSLSLAQFTIHFHAEMIVCDIGKWIYDIFRYIGLGRVYFLFGSCARIKLSFAWTFCGSISMKRYKCIECITRFSVCFHWQMRYEWLKWVNNNNWMLESTTPLIIYDQQAKWCILMIAVKSAHTLTRIQKWYKYFSRLVNKSDWIFQWGLFFSTLLHLNVVFVSMMTHNGQYFCYKSVFNLFSILTNINILPINNYSTKQQIIATVLSFVYV